MADKVVLPRILTLVVCDDVTLFPQEEDVFDLHHVRTTIRAAAFPHVHPQLFVYLQMTGHEGHAQLQLLVTKADDEEDVVERVEQEIAFLGPLEVISTVVWLESCIFSAPGLYYIQIRFANKLLLERPLHLTLFSQATSNGE